MVCDGIRHPNHAAKMAPVRNPQNAAERDTTRRRVISAAVLLCLSAPFRANACCVIPEAGTPDRLACGKSGKRLHSMRHIFLKTYPEGGINRLRALPGQRFPDSTEIPENLNIQADSKIRARCPIGTVFCTPALELRQSRSRSNGDGLAPFMAAIGGIFPMDCPEDPLQPSEEMISDWEEYKKKNVSVLEGLFAQPEETNAPSRCKTLLERIRTEKAWSKPSISTDGFSIDSHRWEMAMTFIHNHDNLLLTGPSGTGKTELVLLACKRLGLECRKYNMGTMSDPMSALLGVHRIKDGKSVFEPAQFLEDIQRPGVVLLDEINRAPLNALNYLMSCLDGTREMRNDYVSPVQTVKVHPECVFVATANIGAEFVGTNMLDPALSSRFFRLQMEYPTVDDETAVLVSRYGIQKTDAINICKVAKDIRDSYVKGDLSTAVTVRQTLMAAKLVSCGYSALEALTQIFLPYFEGTPSEGEMGIVNKMFCAR